MVVRFGQRAVGDRCKVTEGLIAQRLTDVERWSEPENFKESWRGRAQVAAQLVPPGVRLLDLGCGAMDVEHFLDKTVTYIPADVVPRDHRTQICDLNAGQLPAVEADFISLLGVLEYVHDAAALFAALRSKRARIIASYNPVDLGKRGKDRRAQGWFNDFTAAELCALAAHAGLQLVGMVPLHPQQLYEFRTA